MTGLGFRRRGLTVPCRTTGIDIRGAPRSQSEGHRRPDSAQPAGRRDRPVRFGASRRWRSTRSTTEGQRRYVESLSAYARQFLEQVEKPDDVDQRFDGLSARHLHRAAHHRVESAVDGGDRHRDLRLSPPAVRQHRGAALPVVRASDHVAIGGAHRRDRHGRARGRAGSTSSRPSCAAARASSGRSWPPSGNAD